MSYFESRCSLSFANQNRKPAMSLNESYELNLLGFNENKHPVLASNQNHKLVSKNVAAENTKLQGKKVILKTNAISGEKSLIFKQKTGKNIEIQTKGCNYISGNDVTTSTTAAAAIIATSTTITTSTPSISKTPSHHKPTILKHKGRLRYQVLTNNENSFYNLEKQQSKYVQAMIVTNNYKNDNLVVTTSTDHNYFQTDAVHVLPASKNTTRKCNGKTVTNEHNTTENHIRLISVISGTTKKTEKINKKQPKYEIKKKPAVGNIETVKSNINVYSLDKKTNSPDNDEPVDPQNIKSAANSCQCECKSKIMMDRSTQTNTKSSPTVQDMETNTDQILFDNFLTTEMQLASDTRLLSDLNVLGLDTDPYELLYGTYPSNNLMPQPNNSATFDELFSGYDRNILTISDSTQNQANICNQSMSYPSPVGYGESQHWKKQFFLDLKNCDQFLSSGNLPLHMGVIDNNFASVKKQCMVMRIRQINIDTENQNSMTALQLAIINDVNVDIIQLLLRHGADATVIDNEGNNLLHLAVIYAGEAALKLLLETFGMDLNAANFEGYTPLILCVIYKKYVKCECLLTAGANPNVGDKKSGRTPLFHAIEANDVEMTKLLLNNKAHTKVKNFFGTTPHDAIYELDHIDTSIRRLILNKETGPYIQARNNVRVKKRRNEGEPHSSINHSTIQKLRKFIS